MVQEQVTNSAAVSGDPALPTKGTRADDSFSKKDNDVDGLKFRCGEPFDNKNTFSGFSDTDPNITDETDVCKYKEDKLARDSKLAKLEDKTLDVEAEGDVGDDGKPDGPSEDDGLPIDRGWAWVVLAGSFLNVILIVGYGRSIGILFVEYLKIFEASAAETTLFMGVMAAMFSISSLFSMNLILHVIGVRMTVLLGGVLASLGMLTAVFATSITFLISTHSILMGIGHSMVHGPGLVLIGQYFRKRRGLATAVSMSGVSLGGCIFPLLVRYFVDEFGIRGSMLLLTGMMMHILVGGLLYRPLDSFRKRLTKGGHSVDNLKSLKDEDLRPNRKITGTVHGGDDPDEDLKDPLLSSNSVNRKEETDSAPNVQQRIRPSSVYRQNSDSTNFIRSPLEMYKSNPELTSMSMVDLTDETTCGTNKHVKSKGVCDYLKMVVVSLDFSLFKYPMFQLILATACFGIIFVLVGIYLPALAKEKGVPPTETSLLLTISSSVDFFSRLAVGYIADLKRIKIHHLMATGLLVSGTLTHLTSFYNSFGLMVLYSVLIGLFGGFYNCLMPVLIIEFMGQKHMAKTLGFVAVLNGLTMAVTHPILGAIRDLTGSYEICFNYIGACNYIAALCLLCEPLVRWRARKLKLIANQ